MTITNYRRDRTPFLNDLSLHPVHDSDGKYRRAERPLLRTGFARRPRVAGGLRVTDGCCVVGRRFA